MPKISVLMPFYNNEKYLDESIQSILNQTYSDFEFIIMDDGSTDNGVKVVNKYSKDKRIRFVRNKKNIGIVANLNKGIGMSKGEYLARMDGDDVSLPERFEKQVRYLDKHKTVGIVGTQGIIINEQSRKTGDFVRPMSDLKIRAKLMDGNAFIHGSVMIRKSSLLKTSLYNQKFVRAEDYGLWLEYIKITKTANLPDVLYKWRSYGKSREDNDKLIKIQEETYALIRNTVLASYKYIPEKIVNRAFKLFKKRK